jgi:hypothetical protein
LVCRPADEGTQAHQFEGRTDTAPGSALPTKENPMSLWLLLLIILLVILALGGFGYARR